MLSSRFLLTIYFTYSNVCIVNPKLLIYPSSPPHLSFSQTPKHKFVFYVCESVLYTSSFCIFFLDSTYKWYHMCIFHWLTLLSMIISSPPLLLQMAFHSFLWLSNSPLHICTHLLYPFMCQRTFTLFPCLAYCKQRCSEYWSWFFV